MTFFHDVQICVSFWWVPLLMLICSLNTLQMPQQYTYRYALFFISYYEVFFFFFFLFQYKLNIPFYFLWAYVLGIYLSCVRILLRRCVGENSIQHQVRFWQLWGEFKEEKETTGFKEGSLDWNVWGMYIWTINLCIYNLHNKYNVLFW